MEPPIFHNNVAGRNQFEELATRVVKWISDYYASVESFPVRSQVVPGEIYNAFPAGPPVDPKHVNELFDVLDKTILPGITHWQHPNFYAFFPGNTSFPSIKLSCGVFTATTFSIYILLFLYFPTAIFILLEPISNDITLFCDKPIPPVSLY